MLRILLTADAMGGVWQYTEQLASGMALTGIEPVVALMGDVSASLNGVRVIETGLPLEWLASSPEEIRQSARGIASIAASERVDSVHLHSPTLADANWPCPVIAVAHSCTTTWWRAVRGGPMPEAFGWRAEAMRRGMHCLAGGMSEQRGEIARGIVPSALVAPSVSFARDLRDVYGASALVIRNGRDGSSGAHERERFVLCAGRLWDEGKNVGVLEQAARSLDVRAAGPVAGPGRLFRSKSIGLPGRLAAGALESLMAGCGVFAAPSLYEPFGLGVLEAALTGAPLVLADIPTFRELWDGAAVFVEARDAAAWATALRAMLDNPGEWGERARVRALRYPARACVDATIALHRALCPEPA